MLDVKFNFSEEFKDEVEVEEALNNLVMAVACEAQSEDNQTQVVNPIRMQHLLSAYKTLKYLTRNTNTKVTYELHEPFKSMGSITLCGKNVIFTKPKWFTKVMELASNFEAYPKTNGTVEMNFTFHGLTIPTED